MLRIGLLTCNPDSYSSRRLYEAALARGHRPRLYDTLRFSELVSEARPELYYRDEPLGRLDAAIPRIGVSVTTLGLAVVRQLEQLGVFSTSSATPSKRAATSCDRRSCSALTGCRCRRRRSCATVTGSCRPSSAWAERPSSSS